MTVNSRIEETSKTRLVNIDSWLQPVLCHIYWPEKTTSDILIINISAIPSSTGLHILSSAEIITKVNNAPIGTAALKFIKELNRG